MRKLYQIIGQAVIYGSSYISGILFIIWAFYQNTIY